MADEAYQFIGDKVKNGNDYSNMCQRNDRFEENTFLWLQDVIFCFFFQLKMNSETLQPTSIWTTK